MNVQLPKCQAKALVRLLQLSPEKKKTIKQLVG